MSIDKQQIELQARALAVKTRDVVSAAQGFFLEGRISKNDLNHISHWAEEGYPDFAASELSRVLSKSILSSTALQLPATSEAA